MLTASPLNYGLRIQLVMQYYYGAQHDLDQLIENHLFVICPNNSGSTLLKNLLATSNNTWNLAKEGQHTFGFSGPCTRQIAGGGLIWSTRSEWIEKLTNENAYNWAITRQAWYFSAFSHNPQAAVFVTKAPPFLLNVQLLKKNFHNPKFIFMIRNPYAVIEGIYRRRRRSKAPKNGDIRLIASQHIVNCLAQQKKNIEQHGSENIFFTYEDMCDRPLHIEKRLSEWFPALSDLCLRQTVSVKKTYNEPLRNMNSQQIAQLTHDDIDVINSILREHEPLLAHFGYSLMA